MSNLFGLMNIGQSSLFAHQQAIDIAGNNIANVDTPGYTRQRLNLQQNSVVYSNGLSLSTGVKADEGVQRLYDQFLTAQINEENESLGRWQTQNESLQKVELMVNETSGSGLSSAMNQYWNAWQDLAHNPGGVAERTSLLSAGQFLSSTFNQLSESITDIRDTIDASVQNGVAKINQLSEQIAELNHQISKIEVTENNANDFRDRRDQLVFELSELIDIDSFEDGDGSMTISAGSGKPLVEGPFSWSLSTADNAGVQDVLWQDSAGTTVNITNAISGGKLKGWIESRDVLITDYMTQLDTLADTIITSVNGLHTNGLDLNGNPGLDFFTGSGAGGINVNSLIEADVNLIAAADAGPPAEGLPGGNSIAIGIANLQNTLTMSGNTATFGSYYSALVGKIGSDVQSSDFNHDHQSTMMLNLENYRQEVSGVSLDEEMINLVKFQQAYSSAAKLISTADEMMDTLMGII